MKLYLYSFKVVAPQHCNSPLARLGFNIFPASTLPSAFPSPSKTCNSSINVIISPPAAEISFNTFCNRSSNSPRYFAPEINADKSNERTLFFDNDEGTSFRIIRCARPSYSLVSSNFSGVRERTMIAVFPTPAGPTRAGLFFVRRDRIWIVRRISSSRPMTGSSLPSLANSVRSIEYFLRASPG